MIASRRKDGDGDGGAARALNDTPSYDIITRYIVDERKVSMGFIKFIFSILVAVPFAWYGVKLFDRFYDENIKGRRRRR